jgi:hypothetical protein
MALSDVWMATLTQGYMSLSEPILNNFFFTSVDAGANAQGLWEAITATDNLLDVINGIQNANIHNRNLRVINLGSLIDFYDVGLEGVGAVTAGEMLPPHDAVNFTLKLNTRAVKPGSKRFIGLTESMVANGVINDSGLITAIGALEIELSETQSNGSFDYNPVVVKRVGLPTPGTPPYTSYRLPEDDSELVFGSVIAALVNLKVSHQVSRGNGR